MRSVKAAFLVSFAVLGPMLWSSARGEDAIRIAYIEGLSGPFANVGEIGLRHYQLAAETINARGGVKFEIVPFDHKTSSQEAQLKGIKKVYLINQDYSFGQAVAKAARAMIAAKRPDIEIVGDDLHPLGKVKDFAPYVAKIKSSGADSVITGNWGNDLALLVKAGKEAGMKVDYYTSYTGAAGAVTTFGDAGLGHVKQVTTWRSNIGGKQAAEHNAGYRSRFPEVKDDLYYSSIRESMTALSLAIEKAKSTDPEKVVPALENLKFEDDSGEVYIRADNHQLVQPLYISTLMKANGKDVNFDVERTGLGFRTDARVEGKDTEMATTCKFQKP